MLLLLLIEFLDELVFGIREAAWPLIRNDLSLSYVEIGVLLTVPKLVSGIVEPAIGILGDTWRRGVLVLAGGFAFTGSLLLIALSGRFELLLLSFILLYPASGAFVSLSQATLMDSEPERHEHNMARWTFAGSLGVVLGPLALAGVVWTGLGWRPAFAAVAVLALALAMRTRRIRFTRSVEVEVEDSSFNAGLRGAFRSLRRKEVRRWLILLEFSDLMLDILLGFLALYMVDVGGATPVQAGLAVGVWSVFGLLGDFLLIPLLERVRGLIYLRVSVLAELALFPVFLLVPSFAGKMVVLGLLGLFNAGWYSILKGRLYSSLPGQSGTAIALNNIAGLAFTLVPLGIGVIAERFGLGAAMWSLLLGPVALWIGIAGKIPD